MRQQQDELGRFSICSRQAAGVQAIEQVVKYQRDVREVALALELNPDHLRKWIRLYKQELQGIEPAGNAVPPEQREIQQLKVQIKRLEMEKEILMSRTVQ